MKSMILIAILFSMASSTHALADGTENGSEQRLRFRTDKMECQIEIIDATGSVRCRGRTKDNRDASFDLRNVPIEVRNGIVTIRSGLPSDGIDKAVTAISMMNRLSTDANPPSYFQFIFKDKNFRLVNDLTKATNVDFRVLPTPEAQDGLSDYKPHAYETAEEQIKRENCLQSFYNDYDAYQGIVGCVSVRNLPNFPIKGRVQQDKTTATAQSVN